MDPASAEALFEAFKDFDTDDSASVAVFFGEGGAFCAGWDLKYASELEGEAPLETFDFPEDSEVPTPRGPMGRSRLDVSKPVIAAIAAQVH